MALRTLAALLALALPAAAQNAITIDPLTLSSLAPGEIVVRMTSDQPVEAFYLSFSYDPALLSPGAIAATGLAGASEGVFSNVLSVAGGVVVAVISDAFAPFGGQMIPPLFAEAVVSIECTPAVAVAQTETVALVFVDGVFESPPVTNTIVQAGGIAITQAQGLALSGGTVTIEPPLPPTYRVEPTSIPHDGSALVAVTLDDPTGPVSAYTLALPVPPGLQVLAVETVGTVAEVYGAEFALAGISPAGATLDVVMDTLPPLSGQTIPAGFGLTIAFVEMQCLDPPLAPAPAAVHSVAPASGVVGTPPAVNRLTISGLEVLPALVAGEITCLPVPLSPIVFLAGALDGASVVPVSAAPGGTATVTFFYTNPDPGMQGLQLAVCVDCALAFQGFSAIGMQLDEAEFLAPTFDNDPGDGDGCEMTLGALLDAVPPFDGASLPPTTIPLALASVDVSVSPAATPFACLAVEFCDFIDGAGGPPIENLAVVGNESIFNFTKIDGEVCLDQGVPFRRGDVNVDGAIDLGDPVATLLHLFSGAGPLLCPAAADIDGGGAVNIADPIAHLAHLFSGGPPPASPFPTCGVSPGEPCTAFGVCP